MFLPLYYDEVDRLNDPEDTLSLALNRGVLIDVVGTIGRANLIGLNDLCTSWSSLRRPPNPALHGQLYLLPGLRDFFKHLPCFFLPSTALVLLLCC